jgi:hypothetical protein
MLYPCDSFKGADRADKQNLIDDRNTPSKQALINWVLFSIGNAWADMVVRVEILLHVINYICSYHGRPPICYDVHSLLC